MKGLYAQLDADIDSTRFDAINLSPVPQPQGLLKAFAPFMCVIRQWSCRTGASGWPLIGLGCWVWTDVEAHGLLLEAEALHAAGLQDFATGLDKVLDHRRFRSWRPPSFQLTSGCMLWVPYGCIPFVSTSSEFASLFVMPWIEKDLAESVPEEMWAWLASANIACGNKHRDRLPWKHLLPALRAFSGSLFQTT